MTPLLLAIALLQAPGSSIPHRPGMTIVQAVQGDTLRGNSRGDYEVVTAVTSFSDRGITLASSAYVRSNAGRREWLHVGRTVTATDLRRARTLILGFDTEDADLLPGTTALGPSLAVIAEVRRNGQAEVRVRNWARREENPGTLRRVAVEPFPVLLNGRRVTLPAIQVRGLLGQPGRLRPWAFWFFDDPVQPLTLKVTFGALGASESAPAEWSRQIIRIDVPDDGPGAGELEMADGSGEGPGTGLAGAGSGSAQMDGQAGQGGGAGGGGHGQGAGTGLGSGVGVGTGSGAGAGLARELSATCRVPVPGIYFEFDSDMLNPASAPWIKTVADLLRRHAEWPVTIEGHTDSIGGPRYNQDLSQRRAASLKRELVGHFGISAERLGTRGFGVSRPLESNATVEGRARNRRVELVRPCDKR